MKRLLIRYASVGLLLTSTTGMSVEPISALSGAQVNQVAEQVTVFIRGVNDADNFGSGVIIERRGSTYLVLTAAHVVEFPDGYTVTTRDNLQHQVVSRKKFSGIDLALVTFKSPESYKSAKIGNSAQLTPTARVFVAGFPKPGFNIPVPTYTITDGNVTTILSQSMKDGYGLAYTNPTRVGMSGGPVFNDEAHVIGIHGRKEGEADGSHTSGAWLNLGIPINLYHTTAIGGVAISSPEKTPAKDAPPQRPDSAQGSPKTSVSPVPKVLQLSLLPVVARQPVNTGLSNPKVREYCENGDPSKCRTVINLSAHQGSLNESTGSRVEGALKLGQQAYEAGQYDQAIAHYSSALELSPQHQLALHNRGVSHYTANQLQQALNDFRLAKAQYQRLKDAAQVSYLTDVIQSIEQQLSL